MVSSKPRFGGGNNMEHKEDTQITAPLRGVPKISKMDCSTKTEQGFELIPEKETVSSESQIVKMAGKENQAGALEPNPSQDQVVRPDAVSNSNQDDNYPLLKKDNSPLNGVSHDEDKSHGVIDTVDNSSHEELSGCERSDIDLVLSTPTASRSLPGDNGGVPTTLHEGGTPLESAKYDAFSEDSSKDGIFADLGQSKSKKEVQGETSQTYAKVDIARVRELVEVFGRLDIQRKVKLYSKLEDGEKNCWSSIFQESLGERFTNATSSPEDMTVIYCKNLFLKDRKGQFYMVIAEDSSTVDLKLLKQQLNAARNMSFATVDDMMSILQVRPGEVTPFTVMQHSAKDVRVVLHESLNNVQESSTTLMAFHPFSPQLQVDILFSELVSFLDHYRKKFEILARNKEGASFTTAETSMKNETKDTKPGKSSDMNKPSATAKLGSRSKVVHTERKGKLKSYIKKNDKHNDKYLKNNQPSGSKTAAGNADTNSSTDKQSVDTVDKPIESEVLDIQRNKKPKGTSLDELSPTKTLPEIDDFYKSLSLHQVVYREIEMSSVTSNDIGPALGARCFLLKDKRRNYFLVVSHEFYELDYGRLKKALKPKKKLDQCGVSDMPVILGVDSQHLTPFAVMNTRARRNNVQVFFTEKISPGNIVLCLQHPFAQGRRILVKSSELQRLLAHFSFNCDEGCIGVVEEKVWPKKYNVAFSQFDNHDDYSKPKRSSTKCNLERTNRHKCKEDKIKLKDDHCPRVESPINTISTAIGLGNASSSFETSFISSMINKASQMLRILAFKETNSSIKRNNIELDQNDDGVEGGSSVDPNIISALRSQPPEPPEKLLTKPKLDLAKTRSIGESNKGDNDTSIQNKMKSRNVPETKPILQHNSNSSSLPTSNNDSSLDSKSQISISIEDVKHHLDLHNVTYFIKHFGNGFEDNGGENNDDDDDDDDNDSTSQVCHTLHLTTESESNNYLIVGRYSEQISVKRFRRRFQIENKLFIVNEIQEEEEDSSSPYGGDTARSIVMTNPFVAFLSAKKVKESEDECFRWADDKFEMVLFSSIYMDPEMTCVFPVDDDGWSLCMTSQELEDYAKRVGIQVWYMP